MKLKKLFAIEVASIVAVLAVVLFAVEVTPYLVSSKPNSMVNMYDEKELASATVTLTWGQVANAQFNYTTYDPAILVVDLSFQDYQRPGNLSLYCNGAIVTTINVTQATPKASLTVVSMSGSDWVKPPLPDSFTYGNELIFASPGSVGYEGTFSYTVYLRGSR